MSAYYLRLALKSFRRNPGLTALMVGAIALGIAVCVMTLTVHFAVPVQFRDQAEQLLTSKGHQVIGVEEGEAGLDRHGESWAHLVVESADDIEDPSPEVHRAFAQAVRDLLDTGGIPYSHRILMRLLGPLSKASKKPQ